MHELAVTESILEIALRHAASAQAKHINDLYLVIGQLSSIVDDSVQFYWEIISKGTPAEGSQLHFQRLPTRFRCLECESEYSPQGEEFACPQCSGSQIKVIGGEEFYLEAIEVDA